MVLLVVGCGSRSWYQVCADTSRGERTSWYNSCFQANDTHSLRRIHHIFHTVHVSVQRDI